MNPHERVARLNKTNALVRIIERACLWEVGRKRYRVLDPHKDAAQVADVVAGWDAAMWARAALLAGVKIPSQTTRDAVVEEFRSRTRAA